MPNEHQRDERERGREDALRHYELAIAEASYAATGTPEYREAMQNVREALAEIDEADADQAR